MSLENTTQSQHLPNKVDFSLVSIPVPVRDEEEKLNGIEVHNRPREC